MELISYPSKQIEIGTFYDTKIIRRIHATLLFLGQMNVRQKVFQFINLMVNGEQEL